jgi:AAA domain
VGPVTATWTPPAPLPGDEEQDESMNGTGPADAGFRQAVEGRKNSLRIHAAAEAQLRSENAPAVPAPVRLDHLLAEPDEEIPWRIDGLWPARGRVMLAAQFKSGKTTMRDNLVRSLADGDPFLGSHHVTPVTDGTIVVLDFEMSRNMLRAWLRDQGLRHPERVYVIPLRGCASAFDLLDDHRRAQWAALLRNLGAKVNTLDCLGPVLAALGIDENKSSDVGRFLAAYERLLGEAEIEEAMVVHHMGHSGERSRGTSRLRDWPDAEWKLIADRDDEDGSGTGIRYFSAFGRDVDIPETQLRYDRGTRHLSTGGGSRKEARTGRLTGAITDLVHAAGDTGCTQNAIERGTPGKATDIRDVTHQLVKEGIICRHPKGRSQIHRTPSQCDLCVHASQARPASRDAAA